MPFTQGQVIPGANVKILCQGRPVARCTSLRFDAVRNVVQVGELGEIGPVELQVVKRSTAFTVDKLEIAGDSPFAAGLFPRDTTDAQLAFPTLDWQISDRAGTQTAYQLLQSQPTSFGVSIQDGAIMANSMQFVCIAVSDDAALNPQGV